jgi:predicted ATPase/class 3 adenylate cyclase
MDEYASFGAWIQRRRKALDLTQAELAEQVGCALGTIRKIETDERRPSKQIAARLADQLQLAPNQLAMFLKAARAEVAVDQLSSAPQPVLPLPTIPSAVLPRGTVTFLFTDIEGSTQLWERHPQAMGAVVARHEMLLREAITAAGGVVFKLVGDAICAAFSSAQDGVNAALAAQRALRAEAWGATGLPQGQPLRVRMALHTGIVEERGGDYFGLPLSRVARLLAAGHGGQILLSLASEQLVREQLPPAVVLRDLGLHRLKDLSLPEQIFQLVARDLPPSFPPLQTLEAHRTNLPFQPTPLIGRGHEIAATTALLRRTDVRLVTMTGPGGTGKTRLGLQVAAELLDDFADGTYFVNLAPISDATLVASTIAHALGIAEVASRSVEERLQAFLGAKRTLLLLDNFEQVLEAAALVANLLAAAPQLKVLVTSRAVLQVYGEHEFAVPPLTQPPPFKATERAALGGATQKASFTSAAVASVAELTQYDAVKLFITRAQAAKASFTVTNDDAPAIAEICYRLDGLPLAIELAAARIKFFSPEALLARLGRRLQVLTGGPRDLPVRQQTLRNTIDWSYNLLDAGEQALFRRLGVFVGGCTLDAAVAVCNADGELMLDVISGVASLTNKSLLRLSEGLEGEPRFMMLETVNEYATEWLEQSGEAEAARQQHAEYFMELAGKRLEYSGRHTELALFDQLEQELDNIRAALDWSHLTESAAEIEMRLAAELTQFWVVRGYASEGWERLKAALERRSQVTPAVRAHALGIAVLFLVHLAVDPEQVAPFVEEALALNQTLGDREGIAWNLISLGTVAAYQGDYQRATQLNEQGLALYQALNHTWGMSRALFLLGELAQLQDDLERARTLLEQSLTLCRQSVGMTWAIARRVTSLGQVVLAQGNAARARALFVESLTLCLESRDKVDIPMALTGLAGVAQAQGQLDRAARLLGAAEALSDISGSYRGLTGSLIINSLITAVRGQLDDATFAAMWTQGQKMTLDQATAEALRGGG